MGVKENEKIPQIRECLPGANCGACGFAGCDGYAKALAEDSKTATNQLRSGGDLVSRKLSDILGVEFEDVIEQVAFVRCSGDCTATEDRVEYIGISSCAAAKQIFGSKGQCSFGCLGLGDCAKVCPNEAVCLEGGVARVNTNNCVGCGLCVKACPNNIIVLTPRCTARGDCVQQQRQGRSYPQGVQKRLYRVQKVRKGMPSRSCKGGLTTSQLLTAQNAPAVPISASVQENVQRAVSRLRTPKSETLNLKYLQNKRSVQLMC